MAIESATDLAGFFDSDEFGVQATLNGNAVDGIFFDNYEEAEVPRLDGGTAMIDSNAPLFLAATSDVDASGLDSAANNAVVIGGVNYLATSLQPDGTGMTLIQLIEA